MILRRIFLPPYLVLMCLAAIVALGIWMPGAVVATFPLTLAGLIPLLIGAGLLLAARLRFAKAETNIMTFDDPGVLVTDGPFAFTRNPMYLGFLLVLLGAAALTGRAAGLAPVALYFLAAQFWYIPFEEKAMLRRFGEGYQTYAGRVRRWI